MTKHRLLFLPPKTDITSQLFPPTVYKEITDLCDVTANPKEEQYTQEELAGIISDFDLCITGWSSPRFSEKILEKAENLKLILHSTGTITPYIDPLAFKKNILITNSNNAMAQITAEGGLAMIMIGSWETKKWTQVMQEGGWKERNTFVPGVQGKTIGIIGYGAITRAMLKLLRPFLDVKILIYSGHLNQEKAQAEGLQKVDLETLLRESDIVSLQTGLNDKTYHMLNEEKLGLIKKNALLVNFGRGDLVDEKALISCLQENRFSAILDVYHEEPMPSDNPLRDLPNVICFPHLAGATTYCRESMGREVVENLKDFLSGKTPQGLVSEETTLTMSPH